MLVQIVGGAVAAAGVAAANSGGGGYYPTTGSYGVAWDQFYDQNRLLTWRCRDKATGQFVCDSACSGKAMVDFDMAGLECLVSEISCMRASKAFQGLLFENLVARLHELLDGRQPSGSCICTVIGPCVECDGCSGSRAMYRIKDCLE